MVWYSNIPWYIEKENLQIGSLKFCYVRWPGDSPIIFGGNKARWWCWS
jgi:hypothetical protein